jgi:hypothetical protein
MQSKSTTNETNSNENNETKQHFISEEKFQVLRQYQQRIFLETHVSPTVRKIIHELITQENLEQVTQKLIKQFQ